jgi:hypothetical protein
MGREEGAARSRRRRWAARSRRSCVPPRSSLVLRRARGYHLVFPEARADEAKIACFRHWLLARTKASGQQPFTPRR